jgi:hypothetical protein
MVRPRNVLVAASSSRMDIQLVYRPAGEQRQGVRVGGLGGRAEGDEGQAGICGKLQELEVQV